jgi:uncharacterized protein YjbJ (UPF0337 family)
MSERTRIEGDIDEVTGNVKSTVGRATDDKGLEIEGALDQAKGALERTAADVTDKIEDVVNDIRDR